MVAREISWGGPVIAAPSMTRGIVLGSSWVRAGMTALASEAGSGRKEHMKFGWSHSIFPSAMLPCEQRCVADARDNWGAARATHTTPRVKRKTRLRAVNFSNVRRTEIMIALCSPKVNTQD